MIPWAFYCIGLWLGNSLGKQTDIFLPLLLVKLKLRMHLVDTLNESEMPQTVCNNTLFP